MRSSCLCDWNRSASDAFDSFDLGVDQPDVGRRRRSRRFGRRRAARHRIQSRRHPLGRRRRQGAAARQRILGRSQQIQ